MIVKTLSNGGIFEITATVPATKPGFVRVDYRFSLKRINIERSTITVSSDVEKSISALEKNFSRPYSQIQKDLIYEGECKNRERGYN